MTADSCPTNNASLKHLSLLMFFASHSVNCLRGADGLTVVVTGSFESFGIAGAVTVTNSVLANDSDELDSYEVTEVFDFLFLFLLRGFRGALVVVKLEISSDEKDSEDEWNSSLELKSRLEKDATVVDGSSFSWSPKVG